MTKNSLLEHKIHKQYGRLMREWIRFAILNRQLKSPLLPGTTIEQIDQLFDGVYLGNDDLENAVAEAIAMDKTLQKLMDAEYD